MGQNPWPRTCRGLTQTCLMLAASQPPMLMMQWSGREGYRVLKMLGLVQGSEYLLKHIRPFSP